MPKKPIFTKEQVYKTAFEVFKIEGIDGISARNLAKSLGASPAPIYSFYSSIDTLKNELLDEAKKLFLDYVKKERTDSIFLNIGMGICIFAREEKELFQAIFLRESLGKRNEVIREFRDLIKDEMSKDSRFDNLNEEFKTNLYIDCWMYAHGFATLIATNYYENITDEVIKGRLMEAAATMVYKRLEDYQK